MSELLDAEAMKNAAKAVFAKANEGNLKPETIESLWPSQHYPHWDGLAEAAVRAYLSAAPSPSPAPVVEALRAIGAPDDVDLTQMSDSALRGWAHAANRIARDMLEETGNA
jgi:hypothetical protein